MAETASVPVDLLALGQFKTAGMQGLPFIRNLTCLSSVFPD